MTKKYEELEHRAEHQRLLRKYGGCLLTVNDYGHQHIPHEDAFASLTPGVSLEYKHEFYDSPNLCVELIANIPYDDEVFNAAPPAGTTFNFANHDNGWYHDLYLRAEENSKKKKRGEAVKGPTMGLLNAILPGSRHVTQYARVWPHKENGVDVGVEKATLYYIDTSSLQRAVVPNRTNWKHRVTDKRHNPNHTCLSVLLPVDATALTDALIASYDITAEYAEYDQKLRTEKAAQKARLKAMTMAAIEQE